MFLASTQMMRLNWSEGGQVCLDLFQQHQVELGFGGFLALLLFQFTYQDSVQPFTKTEFLNSLVSNRTEELT